MNEPRLDELATLYMMAGSMEGGTSGAHDALTKVHEVYAAEHNSKIPYDFQVSDNFPFEQREKAEDILEAWGVKFDPSTVIDRYFYAATYPEGWEYKPQGDMNGIWSNLFDGRGQLRGCRCLHLLDSSCFLRLHTRYSRRTKYFEDRRTPYAQGQVFNSNGELVFESATHFHYLAPTEGSGDAYRQQRQREYDERQTAEQTGIAECEAWLDEQYPNWRSCKHHWEDD